MWKESEPGTRYEMRYEMPRTTGWRFHVWSGSALTSLDDYAEERPAQVGSNARIVGQHYEVDSVSGSATKRYYANGQLIATRSGTTLRYVQPDHLGSTTLLTDGGGVVLAKERYAAFGERRRTSDTLTTDQLYTGQRYNSLSPNLYKVGARYCDPATRRFTQRLIDSKPPSTGMLSGGVLPLATGG